MQETIKVTIDDKGKTVVEAEGFLGTNCEEATKFLIDSLGTCKEKSLKEEFNNKEKYYELN